MTECLIGHRWSLFGLGQCTGKQFEEAPNGKAVSIASMVGFFFSGGGV